MIQKIGAFVLVQILLGFSLSASAQVDRCPGANLQLNPGSVDLTTNNFPTLSLQVTRNNLNKACNYFVVVDYGSATSAAGRQLTNESYTDPVQIYKDSGKSQILKKIGDATSSNDALVGSFPAGSGSTSANFSYFIFVDPVTYNRFGTYTQNFNISLYSGDFSADQLEATRTLSVSYTQARKIDISLVSSGGAFNAMNTSQNMDFGALTPGESQSFDVIVGYNAGYRMTVSSTNFGRLKHLNLNSYVPYSLSVNGSLVNLSSGSSTLASHTGISPVGGERLPVQVTIGNFSSATPGTYKDTVTFSVVSVE